MTFALVAEIGLPAQAQSGKGRNSQAIVYNLDTPIQTLAANYSAAAILDREIPGLLQDSRYPMFKAMSLRLIASLSNGEISKQMLEKIALQLKLVPVSLAAK